jgi:hypothetical protein
MTKIEKKVNEINKKISVANNNNLVLSSKFGGLQVHVFEIMKVIEFKKQFIHIHIKEVPTLKIPPLKKLTIRRYSLNKAWECEQLISLLDQMEAALDIQLNELEVIA